MHGYLTKLAKDACGRDCGLQTKASKVARLDSDNRAEIGEDGGRVARQVGGWAHSVGQGRELWASMVHNDYWPKE